MYCVSHADLFSHKTIPTLSHTKGKNELIIHLTESVRFPLFRVVYRDFSSLKKSRWHQHYNLTSVFCVHPFFIFLYLSWRGAFWFIFISVHDKYQPSSLKINSLCLCLRWFGFLAVHFYKRGSWRRLVWDCEGWKASDANRRGHEIQEYSRR